MKDKQRILGGWGMRDENRRVLLGKSIPWETWVWGVRLRLCTWLMGDFYSTTRLQLRMPGSSLCSLCTVSVCAVVVTCHFVLCECGVWRKARAILTPFTSKLRAFTSALSYVDIFYCQNTKTSHYPVLYL